MTFLKCTLYLTQWWFLKHRGGASWTHHQHHQTTSPGRPNQGWSVAGLCPHGTLHLYTFSAASVMFWVALLFLQSSDSKKTECSQPNSVPPILTLHSSTSLRYSAFLSLCDSSLRSSQGTVSSNMTTCLKQRRCCALLGSEVCSAGFLCRFNQLPSPASTHSGPGSSSGCTSRNLSTDDTKPSINDSIFY